MKIDLSSIISSYLKLEAEIDGSNVQAVGEIQYPRLFVPLNINVKGIDKKHQNEIYSVQLGAIQGELILNGQKISDSLPRHLNRLVFDFDQDENVYLEFPLDTRRIEWIEQHRQGSLVGSVRISIATLVLGQTRITRDDPPPPVVFREAVASYGDVPFAVPDTQWRETVLPMLGYGKVIAIELPAIPLESFLELDHSFKALMQAQKLFQIGHYDDAVAKCRTALEQFFESVEVVNGDGEKKKIPKLKKSWEARLGQSTYNWLNESLGAIKDAANKPHHSPNDHFDRLGAQMLIMITTALISYAANASDVVES